jgi:hypothetical protein
VLIGHSKQLRARPRQAPDPPHQIDPSLSIQACILFRALVRRNSHHKTSSDISLTDSMQHIPPICIFYSLFFSSPTESIPHIVFLPSSGYLTPRCHSRPKFARRAPQGAHSSCVGMSSARCTVSLSPAIWPLCSSRLPRQPDPVKERLAGGKEREKERGSAFTCSPYPVTRVH